MLISPSLCNRGAQSLMGQALNYAHSPVGLITKVTQVFSLLYFSECMSSLIIAAPILYLFRFKITQCHLMYMSLLN